MTSTPGDQPNWPGALRRYIVASAVLHLAWEIAQLPLYTVWSETIRRQAFAVLHCTLGDLMIAGLAMLIALAGLATSGWPRSGTRSVWLFLLMLGVGYTFFSEWLNISVRRSWAYAPLMPTLPIIGTGLSPLLQWIVVPTLALRTSMGTWPWIRPNKQSS